MPKVVGSCFQHLLHAFVHQRQLHQCQFLCAIYSETQNTLSLQKCGKTNNTLSDGSRHGLWSIRSPLACCSNTCCGLCLHLDVAQNMICDELKCKEVEKMLSIAWASPFLGPGGHLGDQLLHLGDKLQLHLLGFLSLQILIHFTKSLKSICQRLILTAPTAAAASKRKLK